MSKDVNININKDRSDKLRIKTFTFDMFSTDPAIVMVAKRRSGKSWVVRAILAHFKNIPAGLIIAPTDRMSCFYGKFFPDTYIYYAYQSEIIERVIARQKIISDKEKVKRSEGKFIDPRCFVIMDDCLAQKGSWVRDKLISELLFNGRHYKIMYILTMQFPLGITPELRANFDYIFLLADNYLSNMKRMFDHYAGIFPDFNSFRQIFGQLTADHGAMVIDNRTCGKSLFENIYSYMAPNLDNIKVDIGCKQFRDFHKNNYDKDWRKKEDRFNADTYLERKRKTKSAIIVEKERVPTGRMPYRAKNTRSQY